MYLSLFDFEINHVPAEKHQAPDRLSCRKQSAEDSEDEDAEGYLDKFIGCTSFSDTENSPFVLLSTQYSLPLASSTSFTMELLYSLMGSLRAIPKTPFGEYDSPTSMSIMCGLTLDEDDDLHDNLVARIHKYNGFSFDPAFHDTEKPEGSLVNHSLLKSTDSTTYTGHEFEHRKIATTTWVEVSLGGETHGVKVTLYGYEYMSQLAKGESPSVLHDPHIHPGMSYVPDQPASR